MDTSVFTVCAWPLKQPKVVKPKVANHYHDIIRINFTDDMIWAATFDLTCTAFQTLAFHCKLYSCAKL